MLCTHKNDVPLFPEGVPLSFYADVLPQLEEPDIPLSEDLLAARFSPHLGNIRHYFGKATFTELWNNIPVGYFTEFSDAELVRLNLSTPFTSYLGYAMENHPLFQVLLKIVTVWRRWGGKTDIRCYDRLRLFCEALSRFEWQGADVRLDHTGYYCLQGYSKHTHTYLDGVFAYLIRIDGTHRLTLSFTPHGDGVLINQVQLREKKGNRWLYRLPEDYFTYAIKQVAAAFSGMPIYLPDGSSLAASIRWAYGNDSGAFTDEDERRVITQFSQDLPDWDRGSVVTVENVRYYRLEPKAAYATV